MPPRRVARRNRGPRESCAATVVVKDARMEGSWRDRGGAVRDGRRPVRQRRRRTPTSAGRPGRFGSWSAGATSPPTPGSRTACRSPSRGQRRRAGHRPGRHARGRDHQGDGQDHAPLVNSGSALTPGEYRAFLTPTRPGSYTFRLTGAVRGQIVDQTFTSSPTTFNEVEDVANIRSRPRTRRPGQIATRIDREVPRLDAALVPPRTRPTAPGRWPSSASPSARSGLLAAAVRPVAARAARRRTARRGGRAAGDRSRRSLQPANAC